MLTVIDAKDDRLSIENLDRRCNQHAGDGVGTRGIDLHHLELETDDFKSRGGR